MTQKQKNTIMICVGLFLGSYLFRGTILSLLRPYRPTVRRVAVKGAKPSPMAQPATAPDTPPPPPNLSGAWMGIGRVKGKGACTLRAEVKQSDDHSYTAYTLLACSDVTAFAKAKDALTAQEIIADNTSPQPAIMNGKFEDGALHFTLQQAIGADSHGCSISDLTMTPFGTVGVAAKWLENNCPGGEMVMRRGK